MLHLAYLTDKTFIDQVRNFHFSPLFPTPVECLCSLPWKYCTGLDAKRSSLTTSEIPSDNEILLLSPKGTGPHRWNIHLGTEGEAWLLICSCSSSSYWLLPGPLIQIPDSSCFSLPSPSHFLPTSTESTNSRVSDPHGFSCPPLMFSLQVMLTRI